ncbi:MAG: hypothetical protein K2X47_16275 [Bdellovibrionales bacterium]|nr:hypothetical protein [Bdellovibrionales bacterium]
MLLTIEDLISSGHLLLRGSRFAWLTAMNKISQAFLILAAVCGSLNVNAGGLTQWLNDLMNGPLHSPALNKIAALIKDPTPSRDVSISDYHANTNTQTTVLKDHSLYFIDRGYLFRKHLKTGEVRYVKGTDSIKSLVLYKNELITLQKTGRVWLYDESQGQPNWISLGSSIQNILSTNDDTLALSDDGGLWRYQGTPGATYTVDVPIVVSCGENCNSHIQAPVTLRRNAFLDTGIRNAISISQSARLGEILIMYSRGQETLSNLKRRIGI